MILDSLKSFERYITLHERFGKVYEFIKSHDLHNLEEGRHIIEDDNIWCSVSMSEAQEEAPLEAHDSFIDIHVILDGTEIMGFRDRAKCLGVGVHRHRHHERESRSLHQLFRRQLRHLLPPRLPCTAHGHRYCT